MNDLVNGTLVRHVSLGVGKIVALEPNAVHVFFPDSDKRFAAKLRLPTARPLLRTEGLEPDRWLEGLSAFTLDATTGRYGLVATWLTHEQAVEQLLGAYPGGFTGAAYLASGDEPRRAARWRAASAAWTATLGGGEISRLLEEDELGELVKRVLKVEAHVASLHPPADVGAVEEALEDPESARPFLGALAELLSVPSPGRARFERLFATARSLPVDGPQQWLVATLLPFVASPGRHVLLRPRVTCLAAERLGCDLRYEPFPNWVTYSTLRALATRLVERLAPVGASDYVDLEAFFHVTASARRGESRRDAAATTPRARPVRRAGARSSK
jgi:hypothetical protein